MSNIKKVIKNSSIYAIVSILQKAIGFFLLPLYTLYLSPSDYGITAVISAIVSFLSVFYILSLDGVISRFYFDYNGENEKLKEFLGTIILFIAINSVILSSILIVFHEVLIKPFTHGIDFYPYVFLGIISITLNPLYSIFQRILQTEQNGKKYGLNNFSYFLVNVILNIFMVVILKLQAMGVLLASALTDMLFFIYAIANCATKVKFTINREVLKKSLLYSIPLVPHSLAGWTMNMIDRLFLNAMKTAEFVGIYNIGFQFGNIINVLTTAINQAYIPWFFGNMKKGLEGKKSIIKFAEYAVVIYGFIAMCISLFAKEVLKIIVSKDFQDAWSVVPFIAFAFVFNGIYYFFVNPLFYNKRGTKYIAIGTFFSAISNVILNIFLIPRYGMVGSAGASVISNFLASILILYISFKIEKVNFKYLKMYLITFIYLVLSMINFLQGQINIYIFLAIKVLVVIITCLVAAYKYKNEVVILHKKFICFLKTMRGGIYE